MDYQEFRWHIRRADLSISEFARLIGKNTATISNYSTAERVPSQIALIAMLFAECRERGIDFKTVAERAGFVRAKPRGRSFAKREERVVKDD